MERKPIAEVCPGLEIRELPDGAVPLEALVLVKVLTAEGQASWASRCTEGIGDAEALGALIGETDRRRRDYLACWVADEDDE